MSKTITISDESWEKIRDQVLLEDKGKKKVNITIKNRWTGDIIWESEKTTYKDAVEEAVEASADLSSADLRETDLREANLSHANLEFATIYFGSKEGNSATINKYFNTFKNIRD